MHAESLSCLQLHTKNTRIKTRLTQNTINECWKGNLSFFCRYTGKKPSKSTIESKDKYKNEKIMKRN